MPRYQILSLDGGGIRGLLTVRLLERLTKEPGLENAFDSVQMIAGNSSGGLIALAMARARAANVPMRLALPEIASLFDHGADVFGPRWPTWLGGFYLVSRFFTRPRRKKIQENLGNTKLKDLGTQVLITTVDLDNKGTVKEREGRRRRWKPKIFHNFKRTDGLEPQDGHPITDREQLARDVALYTSAAPSYFPTVDGYIDGGVYANNPSMCALAQAFDARYDPVHEADRIWPARALRRILRPSLGDVVLFSVGSGQSASFIAGDTHHWGALIWGARGYVDLTTDASVGTAHYQCKQILGEEQYDRLDIEFKTGEGFALDDVGRIEEMRKFVDDFISHRPNLEPHIEWLQRYWVHRPPLVAVPPEATSKHVLGTTELTCLMPLKSGFVDVFETHTYSTRARILLRALHALRLASREQSPVRVFPDVVDVIRSIHSFQLSILGDQLLLNVTFDRPWEPYMRVVWRDLGPLLDLILLNCEGYEEHVSTRGFEPFAAFVRGHQIQAELLYASSSHTVDDITYLSQLERMVRRSGTNATFDANAAAMRLKTPEATAARTANANEAEVIRQGLIVLSTFCRLRDLYRDETPDGEFLAAAVLSTLQTFDPTELNIPADMRAEYQRELEWLARIKRQKETETPRRKPDFDEIQGGVIGNYRHVTHGCVLLARIEDPEKARTFFARLVDGRIITRQSDGSRNAPSTNVAFTYQGLQRLGLTSTDLAAFPKEFREGMEARAGLIGDVRVNHPENWELPEWNWNPPTTGDGRLPRVRPSTVDVVFQMRDTIRSRAGEKLECTWSKNHPLYDHANKLFDAPADIGIRVMHVQPMVHHRLDCNGKDLVVEHFGFIDGISQPLNRPAPKRDIWDDGVNLGELILGYENDRGDPPFFDKDDKRRLPGRERGSLLDNGTFLVMRKLEQNVPALERVIDRFLRENPDCGLSRDFVLGKLMGRGRGGSPATNPALPAAGGRREMPNDFDYKGDGGTGCPLHAHVRKANPRTEGVPRIARRGMSYGPRYNGDAEDEYERGMMFLAYNASIAEQFEVIQRWMTTGNSTDTHSGRSDPFLRVPQQGQDDVFLIPHGGDVLRLSLGSDPFVSLKWGLYLFVPSLAAITKMSGVPRRDEDAARTQIAIGEQTIAALRTDDQWSALLEDSTALSSGRTAAVCAAIRHLHGGVIRTPGGSMVLVANNRLARTVLTDDETFSVSEYRLRMRASIGEIYLGLDSSYEYRSLSMVPNNAIGKVTEEDAFVEAQATTAKLLATILATAPRQPVRLSLDTVIDRVLADLSVRYFGVPDGTFMKVGGRPDDGGQDQAPRCPFHFLAPSRFIFSSPRPRQVVTGAGAKFGQLVTARVEQLTAERLRTGQWDANNPHGTMPALTAAVWDTCQTANGDINLFARLLVGLMEGFLPTVYGNFLKILNLWLTNESLWRVQQDLLLSGANGYQRACEAVMPAMKRGMQTRPVPDMVFRTAKREFTLGGKEVAKGDRVVVLISSQTQELAAAGRDDDVYPVFGGDRSEAEHPTHACPGYKMGIGVLLGALTALLDAGAYTPTPTPLLVNFGSTGRILRPDPRSDDVAINPRLEL